jgi:hypothetical protein
VVRKGGRIASRHDTRGAALAAAKRIAGRSDVVAAESVDRLTADAPLGLLLGDVDVGEGTRTTLRVPHALAEAARQLADEIGTSKNDAIIRLALAGARVVDGAREVAQKREARWDALVGHDAADDELPDADEMRAASFALRDSGE